MDKLLARHEVKYIRNQAEVEEDPEQILKDIDYLIEVGKGQVRRRFDSNENEGFLIDPDKVQSYSIEPLEEVSTEGKSEIWYFNP